MIEDSRPDVSSWNAGGFTVVKAKVAVFLFAGVDETTELMRFALIVNHIGYFYFL
jgi:hypothetical protein